MGIPGSVGNCDQATREKDRDLRNSMEYLGAGILKKKKNPQKCHFFPKSPILFWKFHTVLESTDFSSFQIKNKQLDKKIRIKPTSKSRIWGSIWPRENIPSVPCWIRDSLARHFQDIHENQKIPSFTCLWRTFLSIPHPTFPVPVRCHWDAPS